MIHRYKVWKLMRNYTNRQVGNKAVQELTDFLNSALDIENFIKNIVDECESLLSYNGTNNNRISKDIIKGVIKQEYYLPLPVSTGGKGDKKRKGKKIPHMPNEVKYHE